MKLGITSHSSSEQEDTIIDLKNDEPLKDNYRAPAFVESGSISNHNPSNKRQAHHRVIIA
jgi:hypothetical protein